MPVKWDARTDQILLLKILETSNVSADVKAISDAWPTTEADKPTPRAITERLGKIRKEVKGGTGSFKVSGQKAAMMTSDVTPQKRAPRGSKSGPGSTTFKKSSGKIIGNGLNGNGKRARNGGDDEYALPPSPLSLSLSPLSTPSFSSLLDDNEDDRLLSLPPPDLSGDEDALNVPASAELYEMLIRYGVITARDDDAAGTDGADDRSQTMMPSGENDDENDEESQTPIKKRAKKAAGANGGGVKVEEGVGYAWNGGMGGENHLEYGFGGDGAGDDNGADGLIFA